MIEFFLRKFLAAKKPHDSPMKVPRYTSAHDLLETFRSSRPEVFCEKVVL